MVDTVSSAQRVQLVDPATNLPYAAAAASGGATAANQTSELTKLDTIHADLTSATPAGTNNIGKTTSVNTAGYSGGNPTYSAVVSGYAGYATPTDILNITGSASKTVLITNILMFAQATVATYFPVYFTKRSTANTGGTPTTLTAVPHDSANGVATAVVNSYAAAPTTGTLVGDLHLAANSASTLTNQAGVYGIFIGNGRDAARISLDLRQPIVLRGAAESLSVNCKGASLPTGLSASFIVEWVEI